MAQDISWIHENQKTPGILVPGIPKIKGFTIPNYHKYLVYNQGNKFVEVTLPFVLKKMDWRIVHINL